MDIALQWAFFQGLDNFIPHPFNQAEFKKRLAKGLYRGQNSKNNNNHLSPCRQDGEQGNSCDTQDDDSAPTGLFSSTFTQFILLLENITNAIIKRLTTKCKQNRYGGYVTASPPASSSGRYLFPPCRLRITCGLARQRPTL